MVLMPLEIVSDIPDELLEHYLTQNEVAIDTELHGLKLYRDQICLIQMCDEQNSTCLIRPNRDVQPKNLLLVLD